MTGQSRQPHVSHDNQIPTPPFWGTKTIERISVAAIVPYINRTALFKVQWGFKSGKLSREAYQSFVKTEVEPIVGRLLNENNAKNILLPQAIYGYFSCYAEGNVLKVFADPSSTELLCQFDFPRQSGKRELCISDYFRAKSDGERDVVAFQVVTVGQNAHDHAQQLFHENHYQDYLYWHGFNVEVTEGLAEFIHKRIRAELGFAREDAREIKKLFKQEYRGSRYSFGYPACPALEDQVPLLEILGADKIGVTLGDEYQLWPEESTTAVIVHHPGAKYFVV